jgi:hypothetical protein
MRSVSKTRQDRERLYATMELHRIEREAAVATCAYSYALWLGRKRNWVSRDCDAGGQTLIEKPWGPKEFAAAAAEKAAIKAFAKKAQAWRTQETRMAR